MITKKAKTVKKVSFKNRTDSFFDGKQLERKTIEEAIEGNYESMQKIVNFYRPYIESFSRIPVLDEQGILNFEVDPDIKKEIEIELFLSLTKFKLENEKASETVRKYHETKI